jgi:hypothetical protein
MGKPLGKHPLDRPRRICDDNISTDLKKVNWNISEPNPMVDLDINGV